MKISIALLFFYTSFIFQGKAQSSGHIFQSWAQKPPMGWNSYNCFGAAVNEAEIRGNAKMVNAHLKEAGWEYIVIDYCWYYPHVGALNNPPQTKEYKPSLSMDEYGRLLPVEERFPSSAGETGFKELGKYIHSLGLKFGIHIMRGIPREAVAQKMPVKNTSFTADQIADTTSTCKWLNLMYGVNMDKPGAQEYYNSLFELYASWGIDFVKVDDISSPYYEKEIAAIRKAIDKTGRQIVLSLSPGAQTPLDMAWHMKENANMWRISGDFWDDWESLKEQFSLLHKWEKQIGPGGWPDADMIPFGQLNMRGPEDGPPRYSNFTNIEKYTLMSLWCIARSPLIYGGNLMRMRPMELKLLTNEEVLNVNQNSTNNRQLFRRGNKVAWIADAPNSEDKYLAIFNLGEDIESINISFQEIGIDGMASIRDLWEKITLGEFTREFSSTIEPHGSRLFKIIQKEANYKK